MAFLRQWLLGVVSCAFLVSLLDQLTPEGSVRKLARFSGGLVLILCMLRPLGTAEPRELALDLDGLSADRAALEEQYRDVSGQSLAAVMSKYAPEMTLLLKTEENAKTLEKIAPFTAQMQPQNGKSACYICQNGACSLPVTEL